MFNLFTIHWGRPLTESRVRFWLWLPLCMLCWLWPLVIQASPIVFEVIGDDSALHHTAMINGLAQDNQGFIWVANRDGVSRFDGVGFKPYPLNQFKDFSGATLIMDIKMDSTHVLWLITDRGLCRYQQKLDLFDCHIEPFVIQDSPTQLYIDPLNRLLIGTDKSLVIVDSARQHAKIIPLMDQQKPVKVQALWVDQKRQIWVGTDQQGLWLFSEQGVLLQQFRAQPHDDHQLQSDMIRAITQDKQGRIWVGTWGGGLSRLDPTTQRFKTYQHQAAQPGSLPSDNIWKLYFSHFDELWITSHQGGLSRYDTEQDQFIHYPHDPQNQHSLLSNQVQMVFEDQHNNLWISCFPEGLQYVDRRRQQIKYLQSRPNQSNTLTNSAILTILNSHDGYMWVGTEDGLNKVNQRTLQVEEQFFTSLQPQRFKKASAVLSLARTKQGEIWVGTWGDGLFRLNPTTGQYWHYPAQPEVAGYLNSPFIWQLLLDHQQQLWIGTETGGLNRYNPQQDQFTAITQTSAPPFTLSNNYVTDIIEDSKHQIWIANAGGLDLINPERTAVQKQILNAYLPKDLHQKRIRTLFLDTEQKLWLGTQNQGVYRWDDQNKTLSRLDWIPHLSNQVSELFGDHKNYIWIGTDNGLARASLNQGTLEVFGKQQGFVGNIYHRQAFAQDDQQRLWLGSTEGITVFNPELFLRNQDAYPIVFTDFKWLQPSLSDTAKTNPLDQNILTTQHINLLPTNTQFAIKFGVVNIGLEKESQYRYRLQGYDRDWHLSKGGQWISFGPLSSGQYVLEVNQIDKNGRILPNAAHLSLTVLPGFWCSIWAFFIYGGVMSVLFYLVWLLYRYIVRLKQNTHDLEHDLKNQKLAHQSLQTLINHVTTDFQALYPIGLTPNPTQLPKEWVLVDSIRKKTYDVKHQLDNLLGLMPIDANFDRAPSSTPSTHEKLPSSSKISRQMQLTDRRMRNLNQFNGADFTILIVDDDTVNRIVLSGILETHHYQILEAASGTEALRILFDGNGQVDLVILDVMMPRMSGLEVCQELRKHFSPKELPVIFLTARQSEEDRQQGLTVGGNDVLYKPVNRTLLLNAVQHYLVQLIS